MRCPACGLELPGHARFCARCGAPQPAPRRAVAGWVLGVLALGVVVTALVATVYAAIALFPTATSSSLDPGTVRTGSVALAAGLGVLCLLQGVAIAGLLRGREWGRVAATIACVLWCLTCVGLPVALFVLNAIWRGRPPATAAGH